MKYKANLIILIYNALHKKRFSEKNSKKTENPQKPIKRLQGRTSLWKTLLFLGKT